MKIRMTLMLLLSMLLVAFSWIMNFGWYRLFGTITLIPFVHAVIVYAVFIVAVNYVDCKKIRLQNNLFLITYLMSNILLSDVNEVDSIMFFGLIHNEILCNIGNIIAVISLIIHIILIILQFVEIRRIDKDRENACF